MPISCPQQSKIKMVALTSGKLDNQTWYSIISKDDKPVKSIVYNMLRRFQQYILKNPQLIGKVNVIKFYDNQTGIEIAEVR